MIAEQAKAMADEFLKANGEVVDMILVYELIEREAAIGHFSATHHVMGRPDHLACATKLQGVLKGEGYCVVLTAKEGATRLYITW